MSWENTIYSLFQTFNRKLKVVFFKVDEGQLSGTDKIDFHTLPQIPNGKGTQTIKTK